MTAKILGCVMGASWLLVGCGVGPSASKPVADPVKTKAPIVVPKGESVAIAAVSESELGAPFYPSSKSVEQATARTKDSSGETLVSTRESAHDVAKVTAWYAKALPKALVSTSATESVISLPSDKEEGTTILISPAGGGLTRIVISRRMEK